MVDFIECLASVLCAHDIFAILRRIGSSRHITQRYAMNFTPKANFAGG
jgi:hypothetical protein